jgi:predicted ATPase
MRGHSVSAAPESPSMFGQRAAIRYTDLQLNFRRVATAATATQPVVRSGSFPVPSTTIQPFLKRLSLARDDIPSFDSYPFSIPAVRHLYDLELHPKVTFFVGENGTGKSTLLEAIAVAEGFNPEGGSRNFSFTTRESHSQLFEHLKFERGLRRLNRSDGYFFRAESYFNVATEIERMDAVESKAAKVIQSYGNRSLHEQSHGESFWSLVTNRFGGDGLYLFDEPEAAAGISPPGTAAGKQKKELPRISPDWATRWFAPRRCQRRSATGGH